MAGGTVRWLVYAAFLVALGRSDAPAQEAGGPAGVGTVAGVVLDKVSGDPVVEAGVEVVGTGKKVRTDLDGRYSVKVPAGVYELRVFAPSYQGARLQKVTVRANEVTKVDATLTSTGGTNVEVVEVVAQANKAAEATQLLKRQKAATVSDNVSAESIAKSPDANAGEVVKRVPAVTVKNDNRYVFIRGLGERYSSAILDGSRLPSPDPDRRVVPLDLFPSDFIESLSIIKSYTPDLPGDFSGGLVDINLRGFPDQLNASAGMSTGVNTSTTFKRFRTYQGAQPNFLGYPRPFSNFPSGLPSGFPTDNVQTPSVPEQRRLANMLSNVWSPRSESAPPNTGLNAAVGNTYGPFGFELAGLYTTEFQTVGNEVVRQFHNQGTIENPEFGENPDDFRTDTSTFKTTLGGILTTAFQPSPNHRFTLRAFDDRNTRSEVAEGTGMTNSAPEQITSTTGLRYVDEELDFGQLGGEHRFGPLEVNWRSALARTTQDVPDGRITTYAGVPGQPPQFQSISNGNSGLRYYQTLTEKMTDSAVDFTIPFKSALPFTDVWSGLPEKFKFGPVYTYRKREFDLRKFEYSPGSPLDFTKPPDQLLNPANVGHGLQFLEITAPQDSFSATQEIIGGYGLFDLTLIPNRLRFIGGVREEYSLIRLTTVNQDSDPIHPRKKNVDPLPGANLVYTPRFDMNVRFGFGQTVSRPDFRELTPTLRPALRFNRAEQGNINLVESTITSYDLRWEWFLTPSEIVSLGGFYKTLDTPIEQIIVVGASDLRDSFDNAQSGDLEGFEFEARKNLGFVRPLLTYLSLTTNAAYIASNVTAPKKSTFEVQTNTQRPLQGQSPFVINAALDYTKPDWGTVRLLYNTAGRRLAYVGVFGLPDIYEERRDQLDFVVIAPLKRFGVPFTAKFSVENILNDTFEFTQGSAVQNRFVTGTKFSFGVSYAY